MNCTNRLLVALVLSLTPLVSAQEVATNSGASSDDNIAARPAVSYQLAIKEAARFAFGFQKHRERRLKLHPKPVQRHTGPELGEVYTNVFIWTYDGRPEAIASVSNWYRPRSYRGLAVTSLSQEQLVGMRDGQEIWLPEGPGVELKPIPDADIPADSPAQRLRQMRTMARDFTAEFKRVARYPEGGKLRLMSQPLYRYESTAASLVDGAIFGFANGTAPQLVLLIEARKQTAAGFRWEYGLAPRNSTEYRVWRKGVQVWSLPQVAPPWPNSKDPTNTYTVFPDLQREDRTQEFVEALAKLKRPAAGGGAKP